MSDSLRVQASHHLSASYPPFLLNAVAKGLLKPQKNANKVNSDKSSTSKKIVVMLYIHNVSHKVKKVAEHVNLQVLLSAWQKLSGLCKISRPNSKVDLGWPLNHCTWYVECGEGVILRFSFHAVRITSGKQAAVSMKGCESTTTMCGVVWKGTAAGIVVCVTLQVAAEMGSDGERCPFHFINETWYQLFKVHWKVKFQSQTDFHCSAAGFRCFCCCTVWPAETSLSVFSTKSSWKLVLVCRPFLWPWSTFCVKELPLFWKIPRQHVLALPVPVYQN